MSIREIGQRLIDARQIRIDRSRSDTQPKELTSSVKGLSESLFKKATYLCPGYDLAGIKQNIERQKIDLLGHSFDISQPIDWNVDPKTEYRWPNKFYADLKLYQIDEHTDIKRPWEVARHQYFFELAMLWRAEKDESLPVLIKTLWLDWIDKNKIYMGIHWSSSLEPAMRVISWSWTLAALSDWRGWSETNIHSITKSLIEHATYLKDHLSFYSSPYNHIIGEATGLLLSGYLLSEIEESKAWIDMAIGVLEKFAPRQYYGDGFSVEQATSYHFYTLGFLVLAIHCARLLGQEVPNCERIAKLAFTTGAAFRLPDGTWPAIGDVDSARALPVTPDSFWNFDSLCECGAMLFDDPKLSTCSELKSREAICLFGGQRSHSPYPKSPPKLNTQDESEDTENIALPDAGYFITKSNTDWLLFDAGSIADGVFTDNTPSTAHGHADTLQLIYYADGKTVLDDSGIPFYNGNQSWIKYFRSPSAHNTFEIDGTPYCQWEGGLAWSKAIPRPKMSRHYASNYAMFAGEVIWKQVNVLARRNVLLMHGIGLFVLDVIQTKAPRDVTWYWQLPADAIHDQTSQQISFDNFTMVQIGTAEGIQLIEPRQSSPYGRRYHNYGVEHEGRLAKYKAKAENKLLVLTAICRSPYPRLSATYQGEKIKMSGGCTKPMKQTRISHNGCDWEFT